MKRKMFLGIAALAVAVVSGYNVYQARTSTKGLSDLALANVEALARIEDNNSTIVGECWKSYTMITECHVKCICGEIWYPERRQQQSVARNVRGKCGRCGNSMWNNYQ